MNKIPKKQYTLISGASSGIGRSIAFSLANKVNLVIHGTNNKQLILTIKECSTKYEQLIWNYDFCDTNNLSDNLQHFIAINQIEITQFIHCAGISYISQLKKMKTELIDRILSINFYSATEIIRTLISKKNNEKKLKNIIVISSAASIIGEKGNSVYSMSKGALDGLVRSLAVELAPQVRVNSILPGIIKTPMSENYLKDKSIADSIKSNYCLGLGEVDDVINAIEFLLSDNSRWITGQNLMIDGGRSLK